MIETGKYSTLKGPICNRDYHDTPSICRYFIANEFDFFLHTCVSMVTQVRRNVNIQRLWIGSNVMFKKNISIHYAEVDIT